MDGLLRVVFDALAGALLLAAWAVWLWRYAVQEHRTRRLGMLVLASVGVVVDVWADRSGQARDQHALGKTLSLLLLPALAALQMWPLLFDSRRHEW
jgi:uncharacterized membrane protein YozB (DUF420 family)